ncbi:MAG: prepilin-type N-terminal cleavage/methylation domain-containing protein [Deltaproteobacteria bacterium]|nr:prepilin-type N-terminal cleavage/methylation domain-containing protein [Deltaproteobacteria bacterium]
MATDLCDPNYVTGFTLVEVMISMLILSVGVLAIMAMQFSTLAANTASRETTEATSLARRMLEMLKRDTYDWNVKSDLSSATEVPLLQPANAALSPGPGTTTWLNIPVSVLPGIESGGTNYMVDREMRPNATPSGLPATVTGYGPPRYCIHYRLTWLTDNELLLAEARVTWNRKDRSETRALCTPNINSCCNSPNDAVYSNLQRINSLIVSTTISRKQKPGQP